MTSFPFGPKGAAWLTPDELSDHWRVSTRTLERWRAEGRGPAWLRLKGQVRYRTEDVLAFERANLRNTAD